MSGYEDRSISLQLGRMGRTIWWDVLCELATKMPTIDRPTLLRLACSTSPTMVRHISGFVLRVRRFCA